MADYRVTLTEKDFINLVTGKIATLKVGPDDIEIDLGLQDIGIHRMKALIQKHNEFRMTSIKDSLKDMDFETSIADVKMTDEQTAINWWYSRVMDKAAMIRKHYPHKTIDTITSVEMRFMYTKYND